MSEPKNDPDFSPGEQKDEHDELLAELDALLEHQSATAAMTLEQRQAVRKYVAEHEGEIEWLREQCRKLQDGSLSADDAQKWFDAFVSMERENSA
jgi:hypothetical protein